MVTQPTLDIGSISGLTDNDKSAENNFKICGNYSNEYICENSVNNFFQKNTTNTMKGFKLLHINCRSINKNFTQIENMLASCHPITALAVSETWLTTATKDIPQITGYTFISSPRVIKSHGGVGIYVNEQLHCFKRADLSFMTSYLECLVVEVPHRKKRSILIGCIYKAPNADNVLFNMHILKILNMIQATNKITFLLGDYNLDLLKYQSHGATNEFLSSMISHSFFPIIRNPTRITESSISLLDNIFTNCIRNNFSAAIIYSDISDHFPIAVRFEEGDIKNKSCNVYTSRSFDPQSICNFNEKLKNTVWDDVCTSLTCSNDPSEAYRFFLIPTNNFLIAVFH